MSRYLTVNHTCRIALTGGPGGGKTTAADLFRREIGARVVIVPETATMLFSGGFPRFENQESLRATQHAIFHTQRSLEDVFAASFKNRVQLCDRGTIDGAAYWPDGEEDFFSALDTSLEEQLLRYQAVIFFETAALGNISIEGGNPTRKESLAKAIELDAKLKELWSAHPHFTLVPHNISFIKKITFGCSVLENIVKQMACARKNVTNQT